MVFKAELSDDIFSHFFSSPLDTPTNRIFRLDPYVVFMHMSWKIFAQPGYFGALFFQDILHIEHSAGY